MELCYFANYKYYLTEAEGSEYFTYDTTGSYTTSGVLGLGKKTYDYSAFVALRNEISSLLTVLDGGYECGALRSFYNATLFKTMLEIAGNDVNSELLPGEKQNKAFLTGALSGTKTGFYIVLSENGESRRTSDWTISESGTVTAEYGDTAFNCDLKGSGENNRFFIGIENAVLSGVSIYEKITVTVKSGTIVNNGNEWHIAEDITFNAIFDGQKWCVENYL